MQFHPTAITLDIFLPDMLGWTVLNNLKLDPTTRHIPVQIISVEEENRHGLSHGAFSYLVKPPTTDGLEAAFDRIMNFTAPRIKRLLVVEDNDIERESIVHLLGHDDIETVAVPPATRHSRPCRSGAVRLRGARPAPARHDRLRAARAGASRAGAVRRAGGGVHRQGPDRRGRAAAQDVAKSIVLKDVQSPERLLDETALFLHRVITDLPEDKQHMLERLHRSNEVLRGRKVLVVDDDARNIFALTSLLENQDMEVLSATNGREAIDIIQSTPTTSRSC